MSCLRLENCAARSFSNGAFFSFAILISPSKSTGTNSSESERMPRQKDVQLTEKQDGILRRFFLRAARVLQGRIISHHVDRLCRMQERSAAAMLLQRHASVWNKILAARRLRCAREISDEIKAAEQESTYQEALGSTFPLADDDESDTAGSISIDHERSYASQMLQRFFRTWVPVRRARRLWKDSQQREEDCAIIQESVWSTGHENEECCLPSPQSRSIDSSSQAGSTVGGENVERPSTTLYTFRSRHTKTESGLSRVFLHAADLERSLCIGSRELFSTRRPRVARSSTAPHAETYFEGLRLLHESIWAGLRVQEGSFCKQLTPIFTFVRWLPKHVVHLLEEGSAGREGSENPVLLSALEASCSIPAASNLLDVVARTHQGQHAAVQHQLLQLRSLRETARPHPDHDDHDAFDAYFDANEDARIAACVSEEPAREEDDWRLRTLLSRGCQFSSMRDDAIFNRHGGMSGSAAAAAAAIEDIVDRQRLELASLRHRMERRSRNVKTLRIRRDLRTGQTQFETEPCRSVELIEQAASAEATRGHVSPARAHARLVLGGRDDHVDLESTSPQMLLISPIMHRGPSPLTEKFLSPKKHLPPLGNTPSPPKEVLQQKHEQAINDDRNVDLKRIISRVHRVGLGPIGGQVQVADVRSVGMDRGRLFVQRAGLQPLFIAGHGSRKKKNNPGAPSA